MENRNVDVTSRPQFKMIRIFLMIVGLYVMRRSLTAGLIIFAIPWGAWLIVKLVGWRDRRRREKLVRWAAVNSFGSRCLPKRRSGERGYILGPILFGGGLFVAIGIVSYLCMPPSHRAWVVVVTIVMVFLAGICLGYVGASERRQKDKPMRPMPTHPGESPLVAASKGIPDIAPPGTVYAKADILEAREHLLNGPFTRGCKKGESDKPP